MSFQHLPVELLISIFNKLNSNSASLRSASRTCRAFQNSAQQLLFQSFALSLTARVGQDKLRLDELQDLLEAEANDPRLIPCIRRLSISVETNSMTGTKNRLWRETCGRIVRRLFEMVPHERVQDLDLRNTNFIVQIEDELASAMHKIVAGPTLRTISICAGQSMSILHHCGTSVEHIRLIEGLSPVKLASIPSTSLKLAPKTLFCVFYPWGSTCPNEPGWISGHDYLVHAQSPLRLQLLKELLIEGGSYEQVRSIVSRSASYLESLHFDWPTPIHGYLPPNTIISTSIFMRHQLPNLRHLCVRVLERPATAMDADPLMTLFSEFRAIQQPLSGEVFIIPLKTLEIQVAFPLSSVHRIVSQTNFDRQRSPLASHLSDAGFFPDLERVEVKVLALQSGRGTGTTGMLDSSDKKALDDYVKGMRNALKSLEKRGVLKFLFESRPA